MTIQWQYPNGLFRQFAILICLSGLMVQDAQATPTRHTHVRALPLGVSAKSYFYLLMERRNPGSYYDHTETLLLVRRDIFNGRLQERIKLRETRFFDSDANENWRKEELPTAGIDLGKYLRKHGVQMVFPTSTPQDWKVEKNQLVRTEKGKTQVLVREDVMVQPMNDLVPEFGASTGDHEFRIGTSFEGHSLAGLKVPEGLLVIIESGKAEYELDFCQHVVFVPDSAPR